MILKVNPKHSVCLSSAKDTMERPDAQEKGKGGFKGRMMVQKGRDGSDDDDNNDDDDGQRPKKNAAMWEVMKCAKEVWLYRLVGHNYHSYRKCAPQWTCAWRRSPASPQLKSI